MNSEILLEEPAVKRKFPDWLTKRYKNSPDNKLIKDMLSELGVNTVCQQARCPNINECFSERKLTFLILGDACTRDCRFCSVKSAEAEEVDPIEADKILKVINSLGIRYVILTSVTRDDLGDGGLGHYLKIIARIKSFDNDIVMEVLTPDFKNVSNAAGKIAASKIDVFAHNIETTLNLYSGIRPKANYEKSLKLLSEVKGYSNRIYTKSGFMLGLGEKDNEVIQLLKDLKSVSVSIVTIGQYLRPSEKGVPVTEFIKPEKFEYYREKALDIGIPFVSAGPFVRSSYNADRAKCGGVS